MNVTGKIFAIEQSIDYIKRNPVIARESMNTANMLPVQGHFIIQNINLPIEYYITKPCKNRGVFRNPKIFKLFKKRKNDYK